MGQIREARSLQDEKCGLHSVRSRGISELEIKNIWGDSRPGHDLRSVCPVKSCEFMGDFLENPPDHPEIYRSQAARYEG
jgi:hypothetical protein